MRPSARFLSENGITTTTTPIKRADEDIRKIISQDTVFTTF